LQALLGAHRILHISRLRVNADLNPDRIPTDQTFCDEANNGSKEVISQTCTGYLLILDKLVMEQTKIKYLWHIRKIIKLMKMTSDDNTSKSKAKGNQSLYRPGQALRVPEV